MATARQRARTLARRTGTAKPVAARTPQATAAVVANNAPVVAPPPARAAVAGATAGGRPPMKQMSLDYIMGGTPAQRAVQKPAITHSSGAVGKNAAKEVERSAKLFKNPRKAAMVGLGLGVAATVAMNRRGHGASSGRQSMYRY